MNAIRRAGLGVLAAAVVALAAAPAQAQNLDGAIAAYKAHDYPEAAARFYEVLKYDSDEGNVAEAEYGLAQSFHKMGLYLPAIKFYEDIIRTGNSHTYYFRAFEGLLDSGDALRDDLKVPAVLDKAYGRPLRKLEKGLLQRIHYALGELSYRTNKPTDARGFLRTVKAGNPAYARAQYVLGLMALGLGNKGSKPNHKKATAHFNNVLGAIKESDGNAQHQHLRVLATMALARSLYEQAARMEEDDPKRKDILRDALDYYDRIERLGPDWPQALFEKAWTHFLGSEYGQALGIMHTLESPAFKARYQPEMHVLRAIVYYYNCHYDRVYKALELFEAEYKPILDATKKINAEEKDSEQWYDVVKRSIDASGSDTAQEGLIPPRLARAMGKDEQWVKLDGMVTELGHELAKVRGSGAMADGPLGEELVTLLEDAQKQFAKLAGKYAQRATKKQEEVLQSFLNQGILVRLETQQAEQSWLEAGRRLQENVTRRRLPRPFIPDDTYIFWSWRQEYWADEVGYYRYSVKSECID